jgi:hypothetical protein
MKRSMLGLIFAVGTLFSTTGCAGGYYSGYVSVPPPPLRAEYYGPAPGPGFVWVGGYWNWRGNAYAWTPGYWGRPPRPRAVWVSPSWEHRGGRYQFRRGYWR